MVRLGLVSVVGALTVLVTTGCDLQSDPLNYESTLGYATRGLVLHNEDANVDSGAQVGMNSTTCAFDTEYGSIGTDYDYPSDSESVDDSVTTDSGDVQVIVTSDKTVHIQETDGWNASSSDYDIEGVLVARSFDDGALVLSEGNGNACTLTTVGTSADATVEMDPAQQCAGIHTLETDPTLGRGWVGSDQGLWAFEGTEVVSISETPSNIVAYDPYTDALYTAEVGGSVVTALDADGSERWTTDVGSPIFSLDDLGAEESVAVSVNYADGTGGLIFLDGWTGVNRATVAVATQNNRVVTSRDGHKLSVASANSVDFYEVNSGLVSSSGWDVDWDELGEGVDFDFELE